MVPHPPPSRRFQSGILIAAFVLYGALAVWLNTHWTPLGDEPHYLLAAHSLVADHDLNLANNYAAQDYVRFTNGMPLDPHVKLLPDGTQVLNHDPGLPLVIALPYALGGRLGVEIFLAGCAALLSLQMVLLAYDVTHRMWLSAVAGSALALTLPLVLYAGLIYPELVGALLVSWSMRTILFKTDKELTPLRLAALAGSLAFLPWLSVRFVLLLALLLVALLVRRTLSGPRLLICFAAAGLGLAGYLVVNSVLLAGTVPKGSPTELAGGNLVTLSAASLARGVLGWWLDPQRGTLVMAPIYILALAGIPRLVRAQPQTGVLLLSPLVVLVPVVAALGGFWIPFEVGARYFVVALPLLAAPLALALESISSKAVLPLRVACGILALALGGISLWNAALVLGDASYAYGSVVSAYSRLVGTDVSPVFASMGRALVVAPTDAALMDSPSVAETQVPGGVPVWQVAAGNPGVIVQSYELSELNAGHYALRFLARSATTGQAPALTLDLYSAEGLSLVHSEWSADDLHADTPVPVTVEFDNPYFDRWGSPLGVQVSSTGTADLQVSALTFDPDTATTWLRAALWLAGVLGVIVLIHWDPRRREM